MNKKFDELVQNKRIVKSSFARNVSKNGNAIIWHSLFGYPKIISRPTIEFLDLFRKPQSIEDVLSRYDLDGNFQIIDELLESYFLVPEDFDERKLLKEKLKKYDDDIANGSAIEYLGLIISEACNFRCAYCIHFSNLETSERIKNSKKIMSFEVAKKSVDWYLEILKMHGKRAARINFGGGEPLLAWQAIHDILDYCTYSYGHIFDFQFSINTNASLLTKEIALKLKEHNVYIASSLDGLREGNNLVRVTKDGKGTFDTIIHGFDILKAVGHPSKGISITVNELNFPFLDEKFIDWTHQRDMREVHIDIDAVNMVNIPVYNIVDKLMRLRQYAQTKEIEISGFWARPIENLNSSIIETRMAFCGALLGNNICVSPVGNIYSCGYSTTIIGTLSRIDSFNSPKGQYHRFVRDNSIGTLDMCKDCTIEGQCGGGCNITREFAATAKTVKIERMCDFYRQMTSELLLEQLQEIDA